MQKKINNLLQQNPTMQQDQLEQQVLKREPIHRKQEQQLKSSQPKKRQKKSTFDNPFDTLMLLNEQQNEGDGSKKQIKQEWIKPKATPLTVSVVDHSKINKFYSHKSLQKYIRYLFLKSCPNPMWLSIKRQSQVEHIVFIDIQIQNDLFHYWMSKKQAQNTIQKQEKVCNINSELNGNSQKLTNENEDKKIEEDKEDREEHLLKFLSQFNEPDKKAVFKQSPFVKQSSELWQSLLVYDEQAVKQQVIYPDVSQQLAPELTQQLFNMYLTYLLTEDQLKYNLYPIKQLPIYKSYFQITSTGVQQSIENTQGPTKIISANKILIIDCQMVMSGSNFQLARTSITNFKGQLIYDQFFKPETPITNYNTQFSGITQETLKNVTKNIQDLHQDLKKFVCPDTILVGHSLENDFHAMKFMHHRVIDTSVLYSRKNGSKMKLKTLAYNILKRQIQCGCHCSSQDCKATLDLMRLKIQRNQQQPSKKSYHLLDQLQQQGKKVVIMDNNLDFIKHRKQYIGVHFQDIQYKTQNRQSYINHYIKYFDKNVKNPQLILSRIRKSENQEWEQYYKNLDETIKQIYEEACNKCVFFLNFQVNNAYEIYPKKMDNMLDKRRPFCLFLVKSK